MKTEKRPKGIPEQGNSLAEAKRKSFFFFFFLAALGLRCCNWASSNCRERGYSLVAVLSLLTAVASLVAEHGL